MLQDKYDDGYISKTDLIQMQTRLKAVSYTHLDVYKRQSLYCFGDIPVYLLKYFPKNEMSGKLSE